MMVIIAYAIGFITNGTSFIFWNANGTLNGIFRFVFLACAIGFGYLFLKTVGLS